MGCFFKCFGNSSKPRKTQNPSNPIPRKDHQVHDTHEVVEPLIVPDQEKIEVPINHVEESKDKIDEKLDCTSKKKVTFDVDVKTYDGSEKRVLKIDDETAKEEKEGSLKATQLNPPNHRYKNCENHDEEYEDEELDGDDDDDHDEHYYHSLIEEESSESLFSLSIGSKSPVLGVEDDEKEVNSPLPDESRGKELIQNEVVSVLSPVENLTQWKARTRSPLKHREKENIDFNENFNLPISPKAIFELLSSNLKSNFEEKLDFIKPISTKRSFKPANSNPKPNSDKNLDIPISPKISFDLSNPNSSDTKRFDGEIGVDTSLSTWLVDTEMTPKSKSTTSSIGNSPISYEDRPILGALTVEEIKQFSGSCSSLRRSPTQSLDEVPIIGTVGSYWSHTGQDMNSSESSSSRNGVPNTTSKYREDKRVKWNSTPFETRLERALNRGVA